MKGAKKMKNAKRKRNLVFAEKAQERRIERYYAKKEKMMMERRIMRSNSSV